jgi:hypothetical protein
MSWFPHSMVLLLESGPALGQHPPPPHPPGATKREKKIYTIHKKIIIKKINKIIHIHQRKKKFVFIN